MNKREQLIEDAKQAIAAVLLDRGEDGKYGTFQAAAEAAFAVFERCTTCNGTGGDEVGPLMPWEPCEGCDGSGVSRAVQAEPLGTLSKPEGTLTDAANRVVEWLGWLEEQSPIGAMSLQADDLRRLVDHARTEQGDAKLPENFGQGEPPDAEVLAALQAYDWGVAGSDEPQTLADWPEEYVKDMRAALRAAAEAGGE